MEFQSWLWYLFSGGTSLRWYDVYQKGDHLAVGRFCWWGSAEFGGRDMHKSERCARINKIPDQVRDDTCWWCRGYTSPRRYDARGGVDLRKVLFFIPLFFIVSFRTSRKRVIRNLVETWHNAEPSPAQGGRILFGFKGIFLP